MIEIQKWKKEKIHFFFFFKYASEFLQDNKRCCFGIVQINLYLSDVECLTNISNVYAISKKKIRVTYAGGKLEIVPSSEYYLFCLSEEYLLIEKYTIQTYEMKTNELKDFDIQWETCEKSTSLFMYIFFFFIK